MEADNDDNEPLEDELEHLMEAEEVFFFPAVRWGFDAQHANLQNDRTFLTVP